MIEKEEQEGEQENGQDSLNEDSNNSALKKRKVREFEEDN